MLISSTPNIKCSWGYKNVLLLIVYNNQSRKILLWMKMAINVYAKDQFNQGVYNMLYPKFNKYICINYDNLFNEFEIIIIYQ